LKSNKTKWQVQFRTIYHSIKRPGGGGNNITINKRESRTEIQKSRGGELSGSSEGDLYMKLLQTEDEFETKLLLLVTACEAGVGWSLWRTSG
jgi:hypothetical protein